MKQVLERIRSANTLTYATTTLVVLLLLKFLLPLVWYDVPLGYDPGIYRYLFLKYAEAAKSFSLPTLEPWATEYPRAFYLLVSPLLIAGVPVDAVLGWMWNLVPVLLACVLAWVTAKRTSAQIGVTVLLMALISLPYYDGFYAMYMKVYVSLIFLVLTYHLVDRMSLWFPLTALATVLLHQQTGLVLVLAMAIWWLTQIPSRFSEKKFRILTLILVVAGLLGFVYYLPQWQRAIWSPLKSIFLLRGDNAPAGSFPDYDFYLQTMPGILLLGLAGFIASFRKERGSLWQISVVIPLIFIVFRLVFYKRFFLLLDFFLLPYAAAMLVSFWNALHGKRFLQAALAILVIAQAVVSIRVWNLRMPVIWKSDITSIERVAETLPENASIIAMENISGPWLRGWAPEANVGAPGLFDYPGWTYEQWEVFIYGTSAQRKALVQTLEGDVFFLVTPAFATYYGDQAQQVMSDPCFQPLSTSQVLFFTCN